MEINVRSREILNSGEVIKSARAIPVAVIPLDDFIQFLDAGANIDKMDLVEAHLVHIDDHAPVPSAGKVMAPGGKVDLDSGETSTAAAIRRLDEMMTAQMVSSHLTEKLNGAYLGPEFTYGVTGLEAKRSLSYHVIPVVGRDHQALIPRAGLGNAPDFMQDYLAIPRSVFSRLLENKEDEINVEGARIEIVGSMARITSTLLIDENNALARSLALDAVEKAISSYQEIFREKMIRCINLIRKLKSKNDPSHSKEKVTKLSQATRDELLVAFIGAQMKLAFIDEMQREHDPDKEKREELKEVHPPNADYLKLLPYLSQIGYLVNEMGDHAWDLFYLLPTHITRAKIEDVYELFVQILGQQNDSEKPDLTKLFNMLQQEVQKLSHKGPVATTTARRRKGRKAESAWKEVFQIPKRSKYLNRVWETAREMDGYIAKSIDLAPSEENLHRVNSTSETIAQQNLWGILAFAAGLPLDERWSLVPPSQMRQRLVEAQRLLAHMFAGSDIIRQAPVKPTVINEVISRFLGVPELQMQYMDIGDMSGARHPIEMFSIANFQPGRDLMVLEDNRGEKSPESVVRKSYLVPVEKIKDYYSRSFVISGQNYLSENYSEAELLRVALKDVLIFRSRLFREIRRQLGDEVVSIRIESSDHIAIEGVRKLLRRSEKASGTSNQRPASQGHRIFRMKDILTITHINGKKEMMELCFYPFETINPILTPKLAEKGFWGFAEKIADDRTHLYHANRNLRRPKPLRRSLVELLYPGNPAIIDPVAKVTTYRSPSKS